MSATVDQVIADFRAGLCPRDPYDDLSTLTAEVQRVRAAILAIHACGDTEETKLHKDGSCFVCDDGEDERRPLVSTYVDDGDTFHVHSMHRDDWICEEDEQEWPCPTVAALGVQS